MKAKAKSIVGLIIIAGVTTLLLLLVWRSPLLRVSAPPPEPGPLGTPPESPGPEEPPPEPQPVEPHPESPGPGQSYVDSVLSELDWGNIAFTTPDEIAGLTPTPIQLLLSPKLSVDSIRALLAESAHIDHARVHISNSMKAVLSGDDFTITAHKDSIQAVQSNMPTMWEWTVTPTDTGRLYLRLALYALIYVDSFQLKAGVLTPCAMQTFTRPIMVKVTPAPSIPLVARVWNFIRVEWKWGFTVVVVPVATYIWKWIKRRRGRKKQRPGS